MGMTGSGPERSVVQVEVAEGDAELVADRLFALGASAVSETSGDAPGSPVGAASVLLVADLPSSAIAELRDLDVGVELLEVDRSWNDGWREHAVAVRAGRRLVVRPEWVAPSARDDGSVHQDPSSTEDTVEIVVDAGEAFGSGSHPTTRLCLGAIEEVVRPGDRVLDVGCGTGVLGVAALLCGARTAVAIDVDPAAVSATRRTADLNGVAGGLSEVSGRDLAAVVADHGRFDLVLANLLVPIIEDLGPRLASAVRPGGRAVLSGLLADQAERAVAAIGARPDSVRTTELDGWCAVVVAL